MALTLAAVMIGAFASAPSAAGSARACKGIDQVGTTASEYLAGDRGGPAEYLRVSRGFIGPDRHLGAESARAIDSMSRGGTR